MLSYQSRSTVCLKISETVICNRKSINGQEVDQQAEYDPSIDRLYLDFRPDCRDQYSMTCMLSKIDFGLPHVYYHEDGCFAKSPNGGKLLLNPASACVCE